MVRRLPLLNGLAALASVLYHSTSWGFVAMFWWTHRYLAVSVPNFDQLGSLSYYGLRVIEQLIAFAIAAFLFISGFFQNSHVPADHCKRDRGFFTFHVRGLAEQRLGKLEYHF